MDCIVRQFSKYADCASRTWELDYEFLTFQFRVGGKILPNFTVNQNSTWAGGVKLSPNFSENCIPVYHLTPQPEVEPEVGLQFPSVVE